MYGQARVLYIEVDQKQYFGAICFSAVSFAAFKIYDHRGIESQINNFFKLLFLCLSVVRLAKLMNFGNKFCKGVII